MDKKKFLLLEKSAPNIWVDRTWLQALYLGDGYDRTWNGNTWTASGNITYSVDAYGKYADINGNRDFAAWPTGTLANITIPNVASLNFTQANNHSWCCTFSMISLPPNNNTWVFGSAFDSAMHVTSTWAFVAWLRWSTDTTIWIWTLYWASRLGETHTLGLSYDSATTRYYVYLDGVLQNAWWTLWPATFLTNAWAIWDVAAMWWNQSSGRKRVYRAWVWNRTLSQAEHLSWHNNAI
jgi:hypothetical protein